MKRITAAILTIGLAAQANACSEGNLVAPGATDGVMPPAGTLLSNALASPVSARTGDPGSASSASSAASANTVAYLSAVPGTFPNALSAAIRNNTKAGTVSSVQIIDGGFDPLGIQAEVGDELSLVVATSGGAAMSPMMIKVPPSRPPGVVRTNPAKGRTDIALNVQIEIVFSEPVDRLTVTPSTVSLLRNGAPVPGTLRVSGDGLTIEFTPASPLEGQSQYSIEIGVGVRDLDGDALAESFVATFMTDPMLPLSSELVFAQRATGQIHRMRIDGTDLGSLTNVGRNLRPVWSPDGQRIAFVRNFAGPENNGSGSADIYSMKPDGSDIARHTFKTNVWFAAWSPDGRKMVVSNEGIYRSDAFIVDLETPNSEPVHLATDAASPAWSPDGRQIAFVRLSGDDGYHQIFVINTDGTGARAVTGIDPGGIYRPVWSPDGLRIAFSKCLFGDCNVYTTDPNGIALEKITTTGTAQEAAWSADGNWLAVSLWEYVGPEPTVTLAYLPANGGTLRPLVSGGHHPSWKP